MIRIFSFFVLSVSMLMISCSGKHAADNGKLHVVVTNFPLYDFTRTIAGDSADIHILVPPGMEPHAFEPKPQDIVRLSNADIFIFTGENMEPWAQDIITGLAHKNVIIVDASQNITLVDTHDDEHDADLKAPEDGHHHDGKDPHIWLDPVFVQTIADTICASLVRAKPSEKTVFEANTAAFKQKLADFDTACREAFARTRSRTIMYGGHFAFGYFARRYGLTVISPYEGFSPDAEPSPKKIAGLIDLMKKQNITTIFHEELIEPRVAHTIARETGAELMILHGAHNLTKNELDRGITYLDIMNGNLERLKKALNYQ